jgi:hypothetical protein
MELEEVINQTITHIKNRIRDLRIVDVSEYLIHVHSFCAEALGRENLEKLIDKDIETIRSLEDQKERREVMSKKWYTSKTVWVNLIALVGAVLVATGTIDAPISTEIAALILGGINFILRLITKEPIEWQKK